MNKKELRSLMVAHGDTYAILAQALHMQAPTLSAKINEKNGIGFTQPEILSIKNRYRLSAEQIDSIFFETVVS